MSRPPLPLIGLAAGEADEERRDSPDVSIRASVAVNAEFASPPPKRSSELSFMQVWNSKQLPAFQKQQLKVRNIVDPYRQLEGSILLHVQRTHVILSVLVSAGSLPAHKVEEESRFPPITTMSLSHRRHAITRQSLPGRGI